MINETLPCNNKFRIIVNFFALKVDHISSRLWFFSFKSFRIVMKIMGANHHPAALIDLLENGFFSLIFPSFIFLEKRPRTQVMINSWLYHLPGIKPRCHFFEAVEHNLSAFKYLSEINPKLVFLQIFGLIIEALVDQKQGGNWIANCMNPFISSGCSSPLICFHQVIIIICLQKPSLEENGDELILDGSDVLLFLKL